MPVTQEMEADLIKYASITAAQKSLAAEASAVKTRLVEAMKEQDVKKVSVDIDSESINATLVEAERVVLDEAALKAGLTPEQWDKVTSRVLDKERLEAAVVIGEVDEQVVAAASEIKKNAASLRVTGKVPDKALPGAHVASDGTVEMLDAGVLKPAARPRVARKAVRAAPPVGKR